MRSPWFNVHSDRGVAFGCLLKVLRLRGGAARSFPFHFPWVLFKLVLPLELPAFQRDELGWGLGTHRSLPCTILTRHCLAQTHPRS